VSKPPTTLENEPACDIATIHDELVERSLVGPVALGGEEEGAWADCDLASLAENRLGIISDPRSLVAVERDDVRKRALTEPCSLPSQRRFERCYWLLEAEERVGTVALATSTLGSRLLRLSSLYIFPDKRRQGVGARALERLQALLAPHRLGIRLETSWSWQSAVRFYLRAGLWVHTWKRDLTFRWEPGTPPPLVAVNGTQSSLSVEIDGRRVLLVSAENNGNRLIVHDEKPLDLDPRVERLWWDAPSTLSLWLAVHGWPLVRSGQAWEEQRHNDFGSPESLAYKITIWEAWDRKQGFRVETPRIPGLQYPTWDELQASWNAPR
jgi:GNAT superfamily N-acetyltransferase